MQSVASTASTVSTAVAISSSPGLLTYVLESWITSWWAVSLVAELVLFIRSFSWRRTYPKFTAYLAFDLAASLTLFWVGCYHPFAYDYLWRGAQVLLIAGRVALVNESYLALKTAALQTAASRPWRPPVSIIFTASLFGGSLLHFLLQQPLIWPASALEPIFSLIGLSNAIMGCTLLGVLSTAYPNLRERVEYRHAVLLVGYLLLTCAAYYSAAKTIDRVGAALMITAACCYAGWTIVMSEKRPAPNAPPPPEEMDFTLQSSLH